MAQLIGNVGHQAHTQPACNRCHDRQKQLWERMHHEPVYHYQHGVEVICGVCLFTAVAAQRNPIATTRSLPQPCPREGEADGVELAMVAA